MAIMEWILARRWIISTGVNLDNRIMQSSEDLLDFATSLRDGIVLCGVATVLKPYSVEYNSRKIQKIDQHEFLCRRNITLFLSTCRDVFHIKPDDLFTTSDLYDLTNFAAVVNTLSIMSYLKEALAIQGCRPFSVMNIRKRSAGDDHRIYGWLSEEMFQDELLPKEKSVDDRDIYDDENYCNPAYDFLICNMSPSLHATQSALNVPVSKREHILKEILDSEESYMKHIQTLVQSYIPAVKAYITPEDRTAVFLNIDQIYTLHLNFYHELSAPAQNQPGCTEKADISAFSRYKKQFLIYAHYCTFLDKAQKRVDWLLKKPIFRNTIEELNRILQRRVPLKGQLSVCFQRILKYQLLLAQLLKNTLKEHKDYRVIEIAFNNMEDVANYINEFKRDYQIVSEIEHIQSALKFGSAITGRFESFRVDFGRHLQDGELQVQFEGTQKREKHVAFLFEQALLLCKTNGVSHEVHDLMPLMKLTLKDTEPSRKGSFSYARGKFSHCFSLGTHGEDDYVQKIRSCRIFTKTNQLKQSWMDAIQKCIKVVTLKEYEGKLKDHAFRLTTFDCGEYYNCDICQKLFLGQVSQGYLCQNGNCGIRAHQSCLLNCPPCQYFSAVRKPSFPDSIAMRKMCVPRERRKKTVEEVTALTFWSTNNQSGRKNRSFAESPARHPSLEEFQWYAGPLSRDQSEDLLNGFPNGSFLIRENNDGLLVLSVQCNGTSFHIKIKEQFGQFYLSKTQRFRSIEETISYYQTNSLVGNFPQLPTVLTDLVRNTYI